MRFLDIDLDFFLDGIAHNPQPGRRLAPGHYKYVHPTGRARDLAWLHFRGFDPASGFLQLKAYAKADVDACNLRGDLKACLERRTPAALEPPIPFSVVVGGAWTTARPFERALLCQSPGFTPRASDGLISVFCDYIDFR